MNRPFWYCICCLNFLKCETTYEYVPGHSSGHKPVLCRPMTKPHTQQIALFPMRAVWARKPCVVYFNRTKWSCHRNMSDDYIENTGQRELAKKIIIPNFFLCIAKFSGSILLVQITLLLFFQLTVCCLKLYFPKVTSNETEKNRKSGSYLLLKAFFT